MALNAPFGCKITKFLRSLVQCGMIIIYAASVDGVDGCAGEAKLPMRCCKMSCSKVQ